MTQYTRSPKDSWFYEQSLHTKPRQPFPYCSGSAFGTIVRSDMLWNATKDKQLKHKINHILISNHAGYQYRQAFPGVFINDIQYFEGSAISRVVYHEIVAPDMILILLPESVQDPSLSHNLLRLCCFFGILRPSFLQILSNLL